MQQYNVRSPAVKRLMNEAKELRNPTELYFAQPVEDNLFEWHFTVRGPPDTDFEGGIYHGRILLPAEYPMKPPNIVLLTPNGRFELNKKICLSISGYHPESWQPSWSIRTALLAIIGFMPSHGIGAIGSLEYPPEERKKLARRSLDWRCPECDCAMRDVLPDLTAASASQSEEAKQLASQVAFKDESEVKRVKDAEAAATGLPETGSNSERAAAEASTLRAAPPRQAAADDGLRQRTAAPRQATVGEGGHTAPANDGVQVRVETTHPPSPPFQRQNNNPVGSASFVMMLIISLMFGALLLRRLYVRNEWRFYDPAN